MLVQTASALCLAAALAAHSPASRSSAKARRHFVSVDYGWQYIQPTAFADHPLAQILGQEVDEVHLQTYQYRTHDQQTLIDVLQYDHEGAGLGATLYPFGSSSGATLALRASVERLPTIRVAFSGPAPAPAYELTGGRAVDAALGIDVSDRSAGWGLGSHAFAFVGIGKAHTDQMDGKRYFAEGGGGVTSGPFGADVSFKYVVNRFQTPVEHSVFMIPISVRATLSF